MNLTDQEREHFMKLLRQPDNVTFAAMLCLSLLQLTLATTVDSLSLGFFLKVFLFGAPVSHGLYVLSLEFSNNLCFGLEFLDRMSAMVGNIATGIPYAELVRYYDAEHRAFYNSKIHQDPETPSKLEVQFVHGAGIKILYLCFYPLIYVYRLLSRHSIPFTRFLLWNIIWQTLFNLYIWYSYGTIVLGYLVFSSYVGFCPLHPFAIHLLMQHQKLDPKLTSNKHTYSYYGMVNLFMFNMGYHRERHDHPKVPWSQLPLVRQLYYYSELFPPVNQFPSPNYYHSYHSTLQVIHDFIYTSDMTLQSTVCR